MLIGHIARLPCDLSTPEQTDQKQPVMEPAEFDPKTSSQNGFYRSHGKTTANPLLVDPYATSDPVQLVLWYHGADISGSPFYSLDARHTSSLKGHPAKLSKTQGQRSSSSVNDNKDSESTDKDETKLKHFVAAPYTDRTTFDLSKSQSSQMNKRPALLTIQSVRESDAGIYWCRVDFRWTRTTISKVRLNVLRKCTTFCFNFFYKYI